MEQQQSNQEASIAPVATEQTLSIDRNATAWLLSDEETNRYIEAADKLRQLSIRLTKPEDWVAFGETVHLQDKRLGELTTYLQSLFGLNVTILKPEITKEQFKSTKTIIVNGEKKDVEIDVIEWIYRGGVKVEEIREVPGRIRRVRTIEPITGSCRTDDKLWSKKFGEHLDPAYVQPSLVMKKAEANYRGNCIRYIWGLKGLDKVTLQAAGLDISKIKDSGIKDPKGQITGEQRDALGALWIRIIEAHGQNQEKAKSWLKNITAYPGGTNRKTGETYNAFDGYSDIYRVKPGSKSFDKIKTALARLEKNQAAGAEQESDQKDGDTKSGAEAFMEYQKALEVAKTQDAVLAVEQLISKNKKLNQAQVKALENKVSQRFDSLQKTADEGGGKNA